VNLRVVRLNFVQTEFTPHGADFIESIRSNSDWQVTPWYVRSTSSIYGFTPKNVIEDLSTMLYGNLRGTLRLICRGLLRNSDNWLIAGWNNLTVQLLILAFFISRKRFGIWVDVPLAHEQDISTRRKVLYFFLRRSRVTVFCVGERAQNSLMKIGFAPEMLKNMRITLSPSAGDISITERLAIRSRYGIDEKTFLISTGSRLIWDKGFDVLIEAVNLLTSDEKMMLHVFIVGKGEGERELHELIQFFHVEECVTLIPWLEGADFRALLSVSNLVVHPSRVDSYGGPTVVALAEGVGVVGSQNAGSVAEIVVDGWNGRVHESQDVGGLAKIMSRVLQDPGLAVIWATNMRELSHERLFTPAGMTDILLGAMRDS